MKAANDQLKQRLEWVVVPDHVYRLASVVFFDPSESPERYEIGYAKKKIERWKANDDVEAFFLLRPVQELIPFLKDLSGSFLSYSEQIEHQNRQHLQNLCTNFSETAEKLVIGDQ